MSDNLSNISKSYWNGEMVWLVNTQYRELINIDPDAVPYVDKLSKTSFFAKTRKGYVVDMPPQTFIDNNVIKYYTTDIRKIDNTWCNDWNCYYMFYQVSPDGWQYRVLKRDCWDCEITPVDSWYRCPCDSDEFFDLDYPIWEVIKEWFGRQEVEWWIQPRFYDNFIPVADWGNVFVWDYIVFYSTTHSHNPWQCWIYRQINSIEDWYITLDTWYEEYTDEDWKWENVWYKIFRNLWTTVGWVWSSAINIHHHEAIHSTICWDWGWCLLSVVNHNGILNVLTDKWYNLYWGIGENVTYFSWLQTTYVWTDKFSSVSFGNFLVFMGKSSIESMVFSEDGKFSYKYNLWETSYSDFGIYSKKSYAVFNNGLYIVAKDKRLYAASIAGSGEKYYLQLEPQSKDIFPELDLLQSYDEVSLSSYQNKLYIFINGKFDSENDWLDKTKILIFNRDYWLWYNHIISRWVISWTKYWLFYGWWLYQYVWDRDVYIMGSPWETIEHYSPIKAEIVFDIVNSENHWIENWNWNRVSLMTNKKINWIKLLLGAGIYTDNTYIEISSYMSWYKFNKKINFTNNEWFNNRLEYFNEQYNNITVSDCFWDTLSKNDNMENKCAGSKANTDIRDELESPVCWDYNIRFNSKRLDDYVICYDDKGYQLSPINHIYINPSLKYNSILYTVKIVSDNYDMINFGWAVVEYESYPINYKEKSYYDIEEKC